MFHRASALARHLVPPLLVIGGGLANDAHAGSANWSIQPPTSGTLAPSSALSLVIPADLTATQLASLAIEIDQIDVTALTHIGGGAIAYAPPQPLAPGLHELRVVEYAAGRLIDRGHWSFTIKLPGETHAAHGWSVRGSVNAQASERIADSDLTPPAPPAFTANGTFDVKAARTLSEWTAQASIEGLYGSNNGTSAVSGQGLQPAQIQGSLERHKDGIVVGDQTLGFDNLVISGLSRRGVSGHLVNLPGDTDFVAFSVRDSTLAGFYGGLGVGNSDDRVSGAVVQSHPIAGAPKALTLQAALVSGTTPGGFSAVVPYPGGNGTFPPNTPLGSVTSVQPGSGSAWVIGAASEIPDTSLHLSGQFARSGFDFTGGAGQPATHADDNAYLFGASAGVPLPAQWTLAANASYQFIGTYFTSLANQALPPDRRGLTASATLIGHGVALAGSDGYTEDNTDDVPSLPTVRSLPRSLNLSYSPPLPTSVTAWLGTPSGSLAWQDARTHDLRLPTGSTATDSDVENESATFNFAYPHLAWQAGITGGRFRDHTGQQDNTDTFGPTGGINVSFAGSGFAGFNLQLLDTHDLKQGTHTLDRNYALTGGDTFWAKRMTGQLTLSINHNTQQIIPGTLPPQLVGNDVVLKTATAQLTWHAIASTATLGGLDVGLSSAWNESSGLNTSVLTTQGFSALATRGWQSFLTLSSRWPLALGDP